ncbi:MAG: anthranilate phosphoribosyltransferase [Sedimentisphaerales bacterium]|nr:anthranilate phosphoribosyltransferase [Sedimentisphaerales bacterium]
MATIIEYLKLLLHRENLSYEQAKDLLDIVFKGEVPESQIAAFLTAMQIKGLTPEELAGFAQSLRSHAVKVETGLDNMVDVVGTGGAAVKTFNVSTASALAAAGAGAYVAKHGNRAITSKSGAADVLEELGVNVNPGPQIVAECIRNANIGFMFAPMYHPAMKYVQPIRKSLGFRTLFNILGPLANPAGAQSLVLGVAEEDLMNVMTEALRILGTSFALVVHCSGLDEISINGVTKICELKDGKITKKEFNPEDFGVKPCKIDHMKVPDAKASAVIIKNILNGKETGPCRDIVVLNSAAALIACGLADNFNSAIEMAENSIKEGKAMNCLEKLIEISNHVS